MEHRINSGLHDGGSLGLFAGLNLLAFILIFLFVEETKRRSLEDLDLVFAVQKRVFVRHQVSKYLPWFFKHYFLGRKIAKPSLYLDLIWGPRRSSETVFSAQNGHVQDDIAAHSHAPAPEPVEVLSRNLSRTSTASDDTHA